MARKFLVIILTICMVFCMFSGFESTNNSTIEMDVDGYDISIEETPVKRVASTIVEGVPMKCEHIFDTDEYCLYLQEDPIQLKVNALENGTIEVFTTEEWDESQEDKVIGQAVLTLSLAAPAAISAAKALICAAAGLAITKCISVSADALGNVIGGIRYNTTTYYRYRYVSISAADAIRFGRMNRYNTCYIAYLSGNTVMIGSEISEWQAINRMKNGYDIFGTSAYVAGRVANAAATYRGVFYSGEPHDGHRDGQYPHYHAFGRRWYKDRTHSPHAWYPF